MTRKDLKQLKNDQKDSNYSPRVSLIIPSLPGYHDLNDKCIQSWLSSSGDPSLVEVILVVQDQPFARNVNEGVSRSSAPILAIVNNDTIALPGWFDWAVSADQIYSFTPQVDCGWGFAIPRSLWDEVGPLDENLVNSYEDYDFFIRAALKGYTRIPAPIYYAVHEGGVTLERIWGPLHIQSPQRLTQCNKNRSYMLRKWPDLNIDAIPSYYWALYGTEIMKNWNSRPHYATISPD